MDTIAEDSLLPQAACVACSGAVVAAYELRSLARSSQEAWFKAVSTLSIVTNERTDQASVTSIFAFINTDSKLNFDLNLVENFNNKSVKPKEVISRLTTKLPEKKVKKPRYTRAGNPCECPDCGQHFNSPFFLNQHLKNSGYKDACLICGEVLMRGLEMKNHLNSVHKKSYVICSSCPALFGSKRELKLHKKASHKPGDLTCGDCGRNFPRVGAFEAHSQMHAVRTCRACGVQFTNRSCYRKHRSKCEPTAKPNTQNMTKSMRSNVRDLATFICDYCNKIYHSRAQLKNHIVWIHMNIRPHQCQCCEKSFYTPARLAEHSVVHTRVRNYECDICGAKLVSKMAAVYHRRRHTGEKPYKCEDCDECFISASRRSEHVKRRHNKGSRFHCTACTASFVRSHELRKHIDRIHKHNFTMLEITTVG